MLRVALASTGRLATRRAFSSAQRALAAAAAPTGRTSLAAAPPAPRFFSGTSASRLRGSNIAAAAFTHVDVKGASELVQGGEYKYADVRTSEEFAGGYCPGAANVPVMLKQGGGMSPNPEFLKLFQAAFPDKTAPICVGCLSGKRSEMAANMLSQAGYTNLKNVEGGYQAWAGAGLPVEKA